MTGMELAPEAAPPSPGVPRRRLRLPASRQGMTWLVVLFAVGILLAVQFGRQVYLNWESGQRAAALEEKIADVEAANDRLEQELAYLRSDAYLSAEARRLTNLGLPGEQVLIIPPGAEEPLPEELANVEPAKPLLQQWLELFFGS